jgi:hypothetical protein
MNIGPARRWLTDFVVAFVLFWAAAVFIGAPDGRAFAARLVPKLQQMPAAAGGDLVFPYTGVVPAHFSGGMPQLTSLLILSVTFSMLVAFNLAFWRHLRRAYAAPRYRRDRGPAG